MAYATLEDMAGSIELVIFPKALAQCGHLLQAGRVVVARGRINVREDEDPKILVSRLMRPLARCPAPSDSRAFREPGLHPRLFRSARPGAGRPPAPFRPARPVSAGAVVRIPGVETGAAGGAGVRRRRSRSTSAMRIPGNW